MSTSQYRPKRPSVLRQRISSSSSTATITRATFKSSSLRWKKPALTVEQEYDMAKRRLYRELDGDERLVRMLGHANLLDSIEDKVNKGEVELFMKLSQAAAGPSTPYEAPKRGTRQARGPTQLGGIVEEEEGGEEKQWEDVSDEEEGSSDEDDLIDDDDDYFGSILHRHAKGGRSEVPQTPDLPDLVEDEGSSAQSSAVPSPEEEKGTMLLPDLEAKKYEPLGAGSLEIAQVV